MSYQWYFNGNPISGATASTHIISSVRLTDAGAYTVTVRNAGGSTQSLPANLTVNPLLAPRLNIQRGTNGRLTFTWTGTARLIWSPNLSGPFNLVPGAVSGYQVLPGSGTGFYQLVL
jgi:hypothetical protein